jgi:hypothetical protein
MTRDSATSRLPRPEADARIETDARDVAILVETED